MNIQVVFINNRSSTLSRLIILPKYNREKYVEVCIFYHSEWERLLKKINNIMYDQYVRIIVFKNRMRLWEQYKQYNIILCRIYYDVYPGITITYYNMQRIFKSRLKSDIFP